MCLLTLMHGVAGERKGRGAHDTSGARFNDPTGACVARLALVSTPFNVPPLPCVRVCVCVWKGACVTPKTECESSLSTRHEVLTRAPAAVLRARASSSDRGASACAQILKSRDTVMDFCTSFFSSLHWSTPINQVLAFRTSLILAKSKNNGTPFW